MATQVQVSEANEIFSMFDCEDGVFNVTWSGVVTVTKTIVIGENTTVTVVGNSSSVTDDGPTSSTGSDSTIEGNRSLSDVEELTSQLALPRGLTSVAMGVASSGITNKPFGSIFFVAGGQLFLRDMIVRDGDADGDERGAGVYAKGSNVSITRCEFINHSSEFEGGGIYVDDSILEVADSTFRDSRAGNPFSEDNDAEGKGGGIHVSAC